MVSYSMDTERAQQIQKDFEKTYNDLSEPIFRHCYFRLRSRERAKEITQDAFMKTWDYLREGNVIENVRAFIYKVANNLIINEATRRKKNQSLEELYNESGFDPGTEDDVEKMQNRLDGEIMLQHLKNIEPNYSEAILMKYVDGLTIREIADILGEKENNVSVRIHRGLEKLRKIYTRKNERD